jgi:hypothetical protein
MSCRRWSYCKPQWKFLVIRPLQDQSNRLTPLHAVSFSCRPLLEDGEHWEMLKIEQASNIMRKRVIVQHQRKAGAEQQCVNQNFVKRAGFLPTARPVSKAIFDDMHSQFLPKSLLLVYIIAIIYCLRMIVQPSSTSTPFLAPSGHQPSSSPSAVLTDSNLASTKKLS